MSSYILKIVAIICMFCDHFGDFYFNSTTFLNYIGRFAFTIFAFQIAQGYIHTHNIKQYIKRLTLFAFIAQIPYMLFYYTVFNSFLEINVIFTLLFGLLSILVFDKYGKLFGFLSALCLGLIAQFGNFDYGIYGVFLVLLFYVFYKKKLVMSISFLLLVVVKYYINTIKYSLPFYYIFMGNQYSILMYSTCLSIIPVLFYNGKKGKNVKYLFYIFYPLHLLILALLKL